MTLNLGRLKVTAYRSRVWWGWFYPRHVHSLRWGALFIGRFGLLWSIH